MLHFYCTMSLLNLDQRGMNILYTFRKLTVKHRFMSNTCCNVCPQMFYGEHAFKSLYANFIAHRNNYFYRLYWVINVPTNMFVGGKIHWWAGHPLGTHMPMLVMLQWVLIVKKLQSHLQKDMVGIMWYVLFPFLDICYCKGFFFL